MNENSLNATRAQLTIPDWADGDDQNWAQINPAITWHLIERHGEN